MPAKVFISYASKDRAIAAHLARALGERGFSTFLDMDVSPGEDFSERIRSEIATSDTFVLVKSEAAANSREVQIELGAAWAVDKPIVFLIPPTRPGTAEVSLPLDFAAVSVLRMDDLSDDAIGAALQARLPARHREGAAP
jgi:hypothetical protein